MENRSYTVGAGLFVLFLIALLVGAILWYEERGHLRGVPYDLISSTSVAGLTIGATVRLRGVEIGQVQSIGFDANDPTKIRVRISVDPNYHLSKGSYATLSYQGLSGNSYVELDFPNDERDVLASSLPVPARIPLRRSAWATLPDTGEKFLTKFTGTLERVNSVLTPDNSQRVSQMLTQITVAAEGVTAVAHDLQPAVRRVGTVITDAHETLRSAHKTLNDFDALVADARTHIGDLDEVGEGVHETGLAARGVEQALVLDTLPKLNILLSGLSQNSDTLQELLGQIKEQPQSLIFGVQPRLPGPGESGFSPPRISQ
jgi:phospholipid/cholesterol/gamma-HCH transport system substrate-binding protein